MTDSNGSIPVRLQEIVEDFELAEGREKLELLLEYSERMPPLPDWLQQARSTMEEVPECMTPVFVHAELQDGQMTFYFDIPPESPTVRGYAAVLNEGLHGATPEQVLGVPSDFYLRMGLDRVLSHQRLNGITAMLAHIKRMALQALQS